jgi:hypothetical protein
MVTSQIYIYIKKKNKGRPEMTKKKKKKNLIKIHKWVFEKTKKIKNFTQTLILNLDFGTSVHSGRT